MVRAAAIVVCAVVAGGLGLAVSRHDGRGAPLRIDAYVWQRQWNARVAQAVRANADLFTSWHVLAAEIGGARGIARVLPGWDVLGQTERRIIPVFRIDGRLDDRSAAAVAALWRALPASARGAIEIDHDCATARLATYATFLTRLRALVPPGTRVLATALPTWLASPDLEGVAKATDQLVLQVHAVDDPRLGLFSVARAQHWVTAFAARIGTPFLVSIPAYGARVVSAPDGGLLLAQAEAPSLDGLPGEEETAWPEDVARFLDWLRAGHVRGVAGVVWFRLPVAGDRRAWGAATLRALSQGSPLHPRVMLTQVAGSGTVDLVLTNDGDADAEWPARLTLPGFCKIADGAGPYDFDEDSLVRTRRGLLHAGEQMKVGWQLCAPDAGDGRASK